MNQLPRSTGVLLVATLLALSAGAAAAREVRMQGPNGEGGACPEAAAEEDGSGPAPRANRRAGAREKAKAAPMLRSGEGGSAARPRWHSILPGMFR